MKYKFYFSIFFLLITLQAKSQQSDTYVTAGAEMIFSFAKIYDNTINESSIMRWAPVFNPEVMLNKDFSKNFGIFTGMSIRNVGYIYGNYTTTNDSGAQVTYKKKFRSYNLGIPLGLKIGQLDKMFFFAGYEIEFPFLYKEKTFYQGDKIDKIVGWFSNREEWLQHGFMAGIQFKQGINLKFKYYFSQFHNQNYTAANGTKPYEGLHSNIFYFSLGSYLFRDKETSKPKVDYKNL